MQKFDIEESSICMMGRSEPGRMSEFVKTTNTAERYMPASESAIPSKTIDLKALEITDEMLITKYMNEFSNFFIPASEHDTFDMDLINDDMIHKSTEIIGQHQPIEVAICETDQTKETNPFHIHLRIIDGRHRWKSAIKHKVLWFTKFYKVKDYNQYMQLRGHFDTKKTITARERQEYFEKLGKYYEEILGVTRQKVCAAITDDFSPTPFNAATIRRYVPAKYKDAQKQKGCYASVDARHPNSIEKLLKRSPQVIRQAICNKNEAITTLREENEFLRSEMGERMTYETLYVLEQLKNNNWEFVRATKDIQKATKELQALDPATYRVRTVNHNHDFIYKETANEKILQARKQSKSIREHYEIKKNLGNKERYRNSLGIIHSILEALQASDNELMISKVSRISNLSHYAAELKCGELESLGLIKEVKSGRNRIYLLTTEGLKFKKSFDKFVEIINEVGLELDGSLKKEKKNGVK